MIRCTSLAFLILLAGCDAKPPPGPVNGLKEVSTTPLAASSPQQATPTVTPAPTKSATPTAGGAPQAVDPATVGSITGIVKIDGNPRIVPIPGFDQDAYCSTTQKGTPVYEHYVIGKNQELANVLVHVTSGQGAWKWNAPTSKPVLDQVGCIYVPHGMAIRLGETLDVVTQDTTTHNVNGQSKINRGINSACTKGVTLNWTPSVPEVGVPFSCQMHPWMSAVVHVLDHPLYAVTGPDGKFTLSGVPPGEYEVSTWHEKLGTLKATVTVGAQEAKTQDFTFKYAKK